MYRAFGRKQWSCARPLRYLCHTHRHRSVYHVTCQLQKPDALHGIKLQGLSIRRLATNAAAVSRLESQDTTTSYAPSDLDQDEKTLRSIFDSRAAWRDFSQSSRTAGPSKGLLGIHFLTSPEGFSAFVHATKQKCDQVVDKTIAASTLKEYRRMARDMDTLSDLLCRVIDVSDFTRVFHHEAAIVRAATEAYENVFEYMNILNTTAGLNEQLKKALNMPEVRSTWSEEEIISAETLVKDFAHSAIDQPEAKRQKFVDLSNDISQAGTEFVNHMEPAKQYVAVNRSALPALDSADTKQFGRWGKAMIPIHSNSARQVMRLAEEEEVRREIYMADRASSKKQIARLERLLLKRAELAKLTGFSSYAQMVLSHKSALAKTPSGVNKFLTSLNASNLSQIKPQVDELLALKRHTVPTASALQPWDVAFYQNKLKERSGGRGPASQQLDGLSAFFSTGTVIAGLSRLFQCLYGIRLVPRPTAPGEVWNADVRRLDVISETEGHMAVVYCDLFARLGKQPNPAHFTLRCSREITQEEVDATASSSNDKVNDGMPTGSAVSSITGKMALHQLPVIALICDFDEIPLRSRTPTLLSLNSVTTLFHEMGHAIHSILGRTSLQTIAGTRCAADFAELPSILMEYFALDPSVLRLYARHWESNIPMSDSQADALKNRHHTYHQTEKEATWHNEIQILMSLLDQSLHSESAVDSLQPHNNNSHNNNSSPTNPPFNSSTIYHQIWNTHGSLPEPSTTSWQGLFGHLYGYGGTYYSYLFDRAIARQVWRVVFRDGVDGAALDRAAGERLRTHVLRYGGGRDPWRCLDDLHLAPAGLLARGGDEAMLEVGRWGVGAGVEGDL